MEWIEVSVQTLHEGVEAIADIFHTLNRGSESGAAGGVVIEDPLLINNLRNSGIWDFCAIPEQENVEIVVVKSYFSNDDDLQDKLKKLEDDVKIVEERIGKCRVGNTQFRKISEHDWENEWKQYFHTTKVGEKFVIKPTWEEYKADNNEKIIEIDPGMAFGTGTHETTCMCIEHIEQIVNENSEVFDVGTGSGILSIAAALMGAKKIVAVDIDKTAVKVAKENVHLNKFSDKIEVKEGDLLTGTEGKADVIIANIIADIIIILLPDVFEKLKDDGVFLASGIIDSRIDDIKVAAKKAKMNIDKISKKGDWFAIQMSKEVK